MKDVFHPVLYFVNLDYVVSVLLVFFSFIFILLVCKEKIIVRKKMTLL